MPTSKNKNPRVAKQSTANHAKSENLTKKKEHKNNSYNKISSTGIQYYTITAWLECNMKIYLHEKIHIEPGRSPSSI